MDIDRFSRWLVLGANVGVLIGLIILIAELRQSSAIAEGQFYLYQMETNEALEITMLGDNPAAVWERSISDPESLSPADIRVMDAYFSSRLYVWWKMFEMEQRGFEEPGATAASIRSSIAFFFGDPFAQTWWNHERETGGWGDILTAMIDAEMLTVKPSTTSDRVIKLRGIPRK